MFVVAVVVLALAAELLVRARNYIKYGELFWGIEDTYTIDPASGLRIPVPNGRFGHVTINSLGFRGPEIEMSKPIDVTRIAFIGASTTYCAEVSSNEQTWPHLVSEQLERTLANTQIEYVNAGVPGYGLDSIRRNLEIRVAPLSPDVIVFYEATNDLSSNSFDLAKAAGIASDRAEKELLWPGKYSLLWYLVEKNVRVLNQTTHLLGKTATLAFDRDELVAPFKRDLSTLVGSAQKITDAVVLVTFSTRLRRQQSAPEQSQAAQTALYYMPYMSIAGLLEGYSAYNDAIREVARSTGAVLVDREEAIPGDANHFVDSVHFTDAGSAAMAERVAEGLLASDRIRDRLTRGLRRSEGSAVAVER